MQKLCRAIPAAFPSPEGMGTEQGKNSPGKSGVRPEADPVFSSTGILSVQIRGNAKSTVHSKNPVGPEPPTLGSHTA
jgi:hypothetical protein